MTAEDSSSSPLSDEEYRELKSQSVTSTAEHGGRRHLFYLERFDNPIALI